MEGRLPRAVLEAHERWFRPAPSTRSTVQAIDFADGAFEGLGFGSTNLMENR